MLYLMTNFDGATLNLDSGDPFDTIVEGDSTVDVIRGAASGFAGTAGMEVNWSGGLTSLVGYGQVDLTNKGAPTPSAILDNFPTHMRIRFDLATPDISGFATNNEVKVLRAMYDNAGTPTELFSITWIKTASNFKWKLSESLGSTTTTGSNFAPSGFDYTSIYSWSVDVILEGNICFIQISPVWPWTSLGETTGASVRLAFPVTVSRLPQLTRIDIGSISGNIAAPSSASQFIFDTIRIENDLMLNPGRLFRSGSQVSERMFNKILRDPKHASSLSIDNAQVGLPYKYYSELGTVGVSEIVNLGNFSNMSSQIPVTPGFMYEFSFISAEHPDTIYDDGKGSKVGRGYFQIQPHTHHVEETSWETPPYWSMEPTVKNQHYLVPLVGQNAILLYNAEFAECEMYIRKLRFFD